MRTFTDYVLIFINLLHLLHMPLTVMLTHFSMLHLMSLMFLFYDTIIVYIRINKIYIYMYLYVFLFTS